MTHSTINTETENAGSLDAVFHTIDITSLDAAGTEQYDAQAEVNIGGETLYGIAVRGHEDETVRVTYDNVADELSVVNVDDGTDVANNTDVGEVILEVKGT